MKKLAFFIALALFLAPVFALQISVNTVEPQPVDVGGDFTLRVTYTNTDSNTLNVRPALELPPQFHLKTSTEPVNQSISLCGLCSRTNTYFISVDSSASSGTYPIFIRTADNATLTAIDVIVRGRPNVVLFPEPVRNATPTGEFVLQIDAANIGTGSARQVRIISKATNFISLGASVATVDSIEANSSRRASFQMVPEESLKAGAYNIPFELNYLDENGASVNSTQNIGVRIVNSGELNVQSIKIASPTGGQPTAGQPLTVIIRLENIGRGDANSLQAEIACNGATARSFLGQLKRDEDAPAVFDITIPNGGKHACTMTAMYTDDLGEHTFTSDFDVTVKDPDLPIGLIILVIIIIGVYYYRRKRKHSHAHAAKNK